MADKAGNDQQASIPTDRWVALDGIPGVEFLRVERAHTWIRYRLTGQSKPGNEPTRERPSQS